LIVAGVMSGTSADGIDVALVRLMGRGFRTRLQLLAHEHYGYPAAVRRTILQVMNGQARVADLARLNFLLGELYAEAVLETQRRAGATCDLIGCHGQTIYHQGEPAPYLGRKLAVTWQTGEASLIAARCGLPVVADFRPSDMAVGGKGAPLVPFLDYLLYRHRRRGRIVQNLGGIGNLTAIPPRAAPEQLIAFDTGPANMLIDALTEHLFDRRYDRDGRIAARGMAMETLVSEFLRMGFFRRKPPRTAGREEFGREFVAHFLQRCGRARKEDILATATLFTARSIRESVRLLQRLFASQESRPGRMVFRDFVVSGGGTKNRTLMAMIAAELAPFRLRIQTSDEFGMPSEAKEAVAFAALAYQTWRRQPGNVPAATGASRPAILGKISLP
jgi:anhydro-N-acetylmuramic acid kinase